MHPYGHTPDSGTCPGAAGLVEAERLAERRQMKKRARREGKRIAAEQLQEARWP